MAQLTNEIKRMQLLAGIINESQSNEEDKVAEEKKVQDQVEKAINSSQSQATLQKMANQLSDEDKQRIMKFMSSVNESETGGKEPDLKNVVAKLMALEENNGPQDLPNKSIAANMLGQVVLGAPVAAMGAGLIKGILAGGAAAGLVAATPLFAAAAAGAVLIGLYKLIKYSSKKEVPKYTGGTNIIKNPILKKSMNENASYTVHLKIDGKTVMSRTSDSNLDKQEMSDNLTALESKYKDKYNFNKAEIVVLDPSGKKVGSLTTDDQEYTKWPYFGSKGGYSGDIGSSGFYE